MPYTQEFWSASDFETQAAHSGAGLVALEVKNDWDSLVDNALQAAGLQRSSCEGFVTTGKLGVHSEHLSYVLGEMQSLARAHPEGVW